MEVYNNTDGSTGSNRSSKGNQLKFEVGNKWYKADFLGYEGASEYAVSELLKKSNVPVYATYEMEEIKYNGHSFNGCTSTDFLKEGQILITSERLFRSYYGMTLADQLNGLSTKDKILCFVDKMQKITHLNHCGEYVTMLLELDALVLNEDRHFHNIAFIQNPDKTFKLCPVFDNGAAFLSDTRNDYPLEKNIYGLITTVKSKPFSKSFEEQMECCRSLYGPQLQLQEANIESICSEIRKVYGDKIAGRIGDIYKNQIYLYPEIVSNVPKELSLKYDMIESLDEAVSRTAYICQAKKEKQEKEHDVHKEIERF